MKKQWFVLMSSLWCLGCGSVRYLWQAGLGQLSIINHSRSLESVIRDPRSSSHLKALLQHVPQIKQFAETYGLKVTKNYSHYVQLDRPYVVWVVSASEVLRFHPKIWQFPILGSVPYLGWFQRSAAIQHAQALQHEGWDVSVHGVSAYSTLGWFQDPILSSMVMEGPEALGDLVNVVIHESVHATVYIADQTFFNESLASFVASQLTPVYLDHVASVVLKEKYLTQQKMAQQWNQKLNDVYRQLSAVYASESSQQEKLKKKNEILKKIQSDFKIKTYLNNADLLQYKTYYSGDVQFLELLKRCDGDWLRFFKVIKQLKASDFKQGASEESLQQENLSLIDRLGC